MMCQFLINITMHFLWYKRNKTHAVVMVLKKESILQSICQALIQNQLFQPLPPSGLECGAENLYEKNKDSDAVQDVTFKNSTTQFTHFSAYSIKILFYKIETKLDCIDSLLTIQSSSGDRMLLLIQCIYIMMLIELCWISGLQM